MAVFALMLDEEGKRKEYKEEKDLNNLIEYVLRSSIAHEIINLHDCGPESYVHQFLYCQSCKGTVLSTRALHYVLSFDTAGCEWEITSKEAYHCIAIINRIAYEFGLVDHQCLCGIHDNGKNIHVHFVVNPVNLSTKKILHYNTYQWNAFRRMLAIELFMKYRVALLGVSFIREDNRMIFSDDGSMLYDNYVYSYDSHLVKK